MKPQYPLVISTLAQRFAMGAYCFGLIALYVFGLEVNISLLSLVALVSLGLGMSAAGGHLGKPGRILNTFANPSSHLTKEMFCVPFVGLPYLIVGLNTYLFTLPQTVIWVLEAVGFVASLVFIWVTAVAYLMPARPAWRTVGTPLTFCLTFLSAGAVAGAAFMVCTGVAVSVPYLIMTCILIALAIVGQILFIVYMGHVGFGADVHPLEDYIRPTFFAWLVFGAVAPLVLSIIQIVAPGMILIMTTFVVYLVGISIWQCFFFLCGKDVKFFPQYPDAPMNPDYF
jgi:anaerobic dimethyl sulfoxide reductase subunit C (anchor subunit)